MNFNAFVIAMFFVILGLAVALWMLYLIVGVLIGFERLTDLAVDIAYENRKSR